MNTRPLYDVPRNSLIQLEDPGSPVYNFHHIDGMYSLCSDKNGKTFHLMASTPVTFVGPGMSYEQVLKVNKVKEIKGEAAESEVSHDM